ncbi:MAG: hypothetical protein Sylvanvirus27_8 [Sylvanvirus sp.]|uniref:Uncharacterized protein n=1 Tax=Sylvanvirus sp. TaxID=2487774 RepID=A0A3G5AJU0_9VIRU|nr:MAG: hypothetical protein Sylvanvirus27_8 [Sylvanvirus sp.]
MILVQTTSSINSPIDFSSLSSRNMLSDLQTELEKTFLDYGTALKLTGYKIQASRKYPGSLFVTVNTSRSQDDLSSKDLTEVKQLLLGSLSVHIAPFASGKSSICVVLRGNSPPAEENYF